MSFNRSLLSQMTKDVNKKPSAPKKSGEYTPKPKAAKGGQIIFEEGGEFVDLQKKYGVDPLSKVGIEKARALAAKNPNLKFVCNASGCAQIASDAATAYDQNFARGNAWDMGNLNNVNYLNPSYSPFMGQTGPLPDPTGYNVPKDVMNAGMQIVGLNRPNNLRSNESKRMKQTPANIKTAAATNKDLANDSFDYANRALYPDTRGYEHVGFNLGDGNLLHGTGANKEHPAFYTIDNMKDGIGLPGYGKYEAVETMSPANFFQKTMTKLGLRKEGGQTNNDRDMVNGIADILSQVTDPQNRAAIAANMVKDFNQQGVNYNLEKFMQKAQLKNGGEMIKRADGSYSKRGLWDNIRANRGSGKKPTAEMLKQERKIRAQEKAEGGVIYNTSPVPYSNEYMDKLQSEYNRFYAGPTIPYEPYGKDDGFDGFYHHKIDPLMRMVKEEGWLIDKPSIPDFQKVFIKDDGVNEEPMPTKKTTVKRVDDYLTKHTPDNDWSRITKYLQEQARVAPKLTAPFMKKGGEPQNAGFQALPEFVQQQIMSNMAYGGMIQDADYDYMREGGIPNRYKNMGFSKVGVKKNSTRPGKKWMVLAKKGDDYKVVHGGYDGMKDFSQHGSEDRKEKFWNRMGGKNSAKASDPFSPLYWHKRFGTWKEGGSTHSGNAWYDIGGPSPAQWQLGDQEMIRNAEADFAQNVPMDFGASANANAVFGQQLQQRVAQDSPAFKSTGTGFSNAMSSIQNKMANEMLNPNSLQNQLALANNLVDGFNNRKAYNQELGRQRQNYSTDSLYQVSGNNPMSRGLYDMSGTFVPNRIGGALSFQGMNQKYGMAEGGIATDRVEMSFIPGEINTVASPFINLDQPVFDMANVPTASVASSSASAAPAAPVNFTLNADFQDYANKAQSYLDKKAPGTDVRGVDLAASAQTAFQKYGKLVPVELALAQLQVEGYLAKGKKPNKPQRTRNPFNIGNTDNGDVVNYNSIQSGIQSYYNWMARTYLNKKTPEQLLQNFTNSSGNRYASAPHYEKSLRSIISGMKFEEGGEVELTQEQIDYIRAMGGEVEFM